MLVPGWATRASHARGMTSNVTGSPNKFYCNSSLFEGLGIVPGIVPYVHRLGKVCACALQACTHHAERHDGGRLQSLPLTNPALIASTIHAGSTLVKPELQFISPAPVSSGPKTQFATRLWHQAKVAVAADMFTRTTMYVSPSPTAACAAK